MKALIFSLMLLGVVLVVLSIIKKPQPPLVDKFNEIYEEEYSLHQYDCSNKSAKYAHHLKKAGYGDVEIIAVDDGVIKVQIIDGQQAMIIHAIVRVVADGETYYCDPTSGKYAKTLADLDLFYLRTISWEEIEQNKQEYGF
jgi:hypothetical protein